jgi:hypothetical protein
MQQCLYLTNWAVYVSNPKLFEYDKVDQVHLLINEIC